MTHQCFSSIPLKKGYPQNFTVKQGWCGRVGKSDCSRRRRGRAQITEKHTHFQNHIEYFSATLSQVCIKHDELGRLVAGLTAKLKPLGSCVKSLDCGFHLSAKRERNAGNDPLLNIKTEILNLGIQWRVS